MSGGRLVIGPERRLRPRVRRLWRWVALGLFLCVLVARWLFVELVVVRGNSMAPTTLEGDVLLVLRRAQPAVGEVVVLGQGDKAVLRRVIAGPGARVESDEGVLVVDGVPLETRVVGSFAFRGADESASGLASEEIRPRRQQHFKERLPDGRRHELLGDYVGAVRIWSLELPAIDVPQGHLFVLCDNRRACGLDELAGVVPAAWVQGVARAILWYGEARVRPPEDQPIYGAFEWLRSRADPPK